MKKSSQSLANRLVAHRGYSQCYPENTLIALRVALSAGARYVEFDVQFTADSVPMLFHDVELQRITGVSGTIHQLKAAELNAFRASEAERFADQFSDEPIPSLNDALKLLAEWPEAIAFVEIKTETVERFGAESVAQDMVARLAGNQHNCILISFDAQVLQAARNAGMKRIGWVVSSWSEAVRVQAESLKPDYLFCNYKKIPEDDELWSGSWLWALYDVVDPGVALHWFARGAQLIETWDIGAMINDARLQASECVPRLKE